MNPDEESPYQHEGETYNERERERERERESSLALRTALLLVAAIATLLVAISCDNKTPEPTFTVTFNGNVSPDATEQPTGVPTQITVKENQTVTKPADPIRTGYTFDGWFTEPGCTNTYDFATEQVTKDITLYAKWKINHVTVKFHAPDESELSSDKDGDFGTDLTLDIASETGKDFLGWYDNQACTGTPVPLSTTFPAKDATYYAKLVNSTEIGNSFEFTDNNATVSKYKGSETDVVIPYTHSDTRITKIGDSAFHNNEGKAVTKVFIPEGVTSIETSAFWSCSNLTSVSIPEGVTSIGHQAFATCPALKNIKLPASLETIGSYAFDGSGLTEVTIPGSVKTLETSLFMECKSLETVTISDGVPSIANSMFSECDKLSTIHIPDSVTSIGIGAFYGNTSLTSITIPASVTSIASNTFKNCTNLAEIIIDESKLDTASKAAKPWGAVNATNIHAPTP